MRNEQRNPIRNTSRNSSRNRSSKPRGTAPEHRAFTVKEPIELLPFLLQVSNRGRNSVKSMLERGQVSVDNEVVTAYNLTLHAGQTVSVSHEKGIERPKMVGLRILYEDEHIIVIEKDAGLLSIASANEVEMTAYRQLMAHVRAADPDNRIFVVHRLDRDTSGVMLFAKSEEIKHALQNSWQEAVHERTYIALVEGMVKKSEGTVSSWLKESKTLKMYSSERPNDGQHAVTHYKLLQSSRSFSLLEVQLETGRKNQIRVHMQDIGHPIVGDKKYGSKSKMIGRLGLHARTLEFTHPVTGDVMRFDSGIPKKFRSPFKDNPTK
ncbi:MAG: pseudouridine synthase, RluA family protein [Bacilli bacterium]|nr:pseudouridine synthase, RluA family protein [Bacilli bacterium]